MNIVYPLDTNIYINNRKREEIHNVTLFYSIDEPLVKVTLEITDRIDLYPELKGEDDIIGVAKGNGILQRINDNNIYILMDRETNHPLFF